MAFLLAYLLFTFLFPRPEKSMTFRVIDKQENSKKGGVFTQIPYFSHKGKTLHPLGKIHSFKSRPNFGKTSSSGKVNRQS